MRHVYAAVFWLLLASACGESRGGPGDPTLAPTAIGRLEPQPDSCTLGLTTELKALVTDVNGTPVPGVVVTFTVEAGNGAVSPPMATTNANGIATSVFTCAPPAAGGAIVVVASFEGAEQSQAQWRLYPRAGSLALVDFFVTARPDSIPIAAGFTQPLFLRGLLRDPFGESPPATVTWEVKSGGGSLSQHTTPSLECSLFPSTWSLLEAWCVSNTWTLGAMELGIQSIGLSSPDAPDFEQEYHVRVVPGPFTIVPEPSSELIGEAGSILPTPLAVRVLDGNGSPIPRVVVLFRVRGDIDPVNPADTIWNSDYQYTDANGRAAMRYTFPTVADGLTYSMGTHVFIITENGQHGSAGWSLRVLPGPPAQFGFLSGNNQSGSLGQTLGQPLSVVLQDQFGNVTSGQTVTWAVTSGGGSLAESITVSSELAGHKNFWTLGPTPGVQTATASFGAQTVTFTAFAGSGS